MKKLYLFLLSSLAVILFAVGIFSLVQMGFSAEPDREDRAAMPEFSFSALLDGSYTAGLENYYADRFPFRDFFLSANRLMNKFYYFSPGKNILAIDYQGGAEQGGTSLADPVQSENTEDTPLQQNKPPVHQDKPPVEQPNEKDVTSVGTIIINGNRAMDIPTAVNENIVLYGETVNRIADAVGDDVRVFSLVTPNSGQFYSPTSYHTGLHDQEAMIQLCYGAMNDRVTTVDAYSVLEEHAEEYLFFRTDHHWTQKGAYYAYMAFCEAAGFTAPDLAEYAAGNYEDFVGSMFNYTSGYPQSKALKEEPDTLTYYLPLAQTYAAYYADTALVNGVKIPVVDTNLSESVGNKYLCFICGDTPVCVIESDAEGGVCMVLKESYGNAFVPFLTSHYSKIICIDPREFSGEGEPVMDLAAFAAEQGVDDLLILNYPFMISNSSYIANLNSLLAD